MQKLTLFVFACLLFGEAAYAKPTKKQLDKMAKDQAWTFEFNDPESLPKYPTGLLRPPGYKRKKPDRSFLKADVKIPKVFGPKVWAEKIGVQFTGIFDQKSCGSCVYNSYMKNLADSLILRGVAVPQLSRQFAMDCAAEWSCSGSFFERVAAGVVRVGGVPAESDYPYMARDQSCKAVNATKIAKPVGYKIIDNSWKSVATALHQGFPVSVTVAADNTWMSYRSGIYSANTSASTNHEVLLEKGDCESSIDADGNCLFDAKGNPVNGDGYFVVDNSWNTNWGEQGTMRSRWLKNALGEESAIIDTGIEFKEPLPPSPTPTPTPTPVPPAPKPSGEPVWFWIIMGVAGTLVIILAIAGVKHLFFEKKLS